MGDHANDTARRLAVGLCVLAAACNPAPIDDTDNLFPAAVLGYPSDASGGAGDPADVPALTGDAAGESGLDGTYRLSCIKIEQLGSVGADAFQTQFLGVAWTADIDAFKLNIMVGLSELDTATGEGTLQVLSGVGTSKANLCAEQSTLSAQVPGAFAAGAGLVKPQSDADLLDDGFCVEDLTADASDAAGTVHFELSTEQVVWIYAEDNDGTPFNCNASPSIPNAVPLRGVSADIVIGEGAAWAAGRLHGCLTFEEAEVLCSCIGQCIGPAGVGACVGCPDGSKPLSDQLTGVTTSESCTAVMGVPAFDLTASFSAARLPHVAEPCAAE